MDSVQTLTPMLLFTVLQFVTSIRLDWILRAMMVITTTATPAATVTGRSVLDLVGAPPAAQAGAARVVHRRVPLHTRFLQRELRLAGSLSQELFGRTLREIMCGGIRMQLSRSGPCY
jgi:hypothetical protein